MRTRVFISGPLTRGDVATNVRRALRVFHGLLDHGYAPFCPHLFVHAEEHRKRPREAWLQLDNEWLATCHAVLRLPGKSPGADAEVALANQLGIPVFLSQIDLYECEPAERPGGE